MALQEMLQNLGGFQSLAANAQQMQRQEEQSSNTRKASKLLRTFYQSQKEGKPNFDAFNEAVLLSPEMSQNVLTNLGLQDKRTQQQAANELTSLYQSLGNEQQFGATSAKLVNDYMAAGKSPDQILSVVEAYRTGGAQAAAQAMKPVAAAFVNQGFIKPELVGFGVADDKKTPNSQREFEYYQELQKKNPQLAEQFARSRGYIESGREQSKSEAQKDWDTYQSLKKTDPKAANEFGQKVGFVSKEGRELSAQTQKRLSEFNDAATLAANNVVKYEDLASQFDQGIEGGVISGSWGEYFADLTGNQDWKTELRKDFAQVRASEAVRNLPPGAASDADIALALKPFPSDNASGAQVASFLRGLSKLSAFNEKYNSFKANYISEKGTERGMLEAWKQYAKENDVIAPTPQRTLGKEPVKVGRFVVEPE